MPRFGPSVQGLTQLAPILIQTSGTARCRASGLGAVLAEATWARSRMRPR